MEPSDIVCRLLDAGLCLHPSALREIKSLENPSAIVDDIINNRPGKGGFITYEDLHDLKVVIKKGKRWPAEECDGDYSIRDLHKEAPSKGNIQGFLEYFNSRYEKGLTVFRKRRHLFDTFTVEQALSAGPKTELKVIGLTESIRTSKKGNIIIYLEDPTGMIPVVVLSSEKELYEFSRTIVNDDIICVEGVTGSGEGGILIAREITLPDIPITGKRSTPKCEQPLGIAMISDIHVGSFEFMEEAFNRFIKWLKGEVGTQRQQDLAKKIKYLVVAGDLVDGVGIYPGQIDDLSIPDIYGQYKRLAEFFDLIPDHIEIFVSPGNHDATRQAEPQPPIFEDMAPDLYTNPNIHMIGNPSYLTLHGTKVLVYHGRSMDDIISNIPEMSYSDPEKAMLNLLKKRQLVPTFGEKVPVTPGSVDCLFMDEVPHIFHSGHVHTTGVQGYRGVTIVNSGAFQSQTDFQKRVNMFPDPGKVPVYDLQSNQTTIMKFV